MTRAPTALRARDVSESALNPLVAAGFGLEVTLNDRPIKIRASAPSRIAYVVGRPRGPIASASWLSGMSAAIQ
jgi:hypothetical protein